MFSQGKSGRKIGKQQNYGNSKSGCRSREKTQGRVEGREKSQGGIE